MVEVTCLDYVPSRVMDLLKIFLAAGSRGEMQVLVLETKSKAVNTKYRSMDTLSGMPTPPSSTCPKRRRNNPARAKRSQLRLENFAKKKIEEKARQEDQQILGSQAAGITSSNCNSNRLVLELAKKEDRPATGTGLSVSSPILQFDGEIEEEIPLRVATMMMTL